MKTNETNYVKAINIIVEDVIKDLEGHYSDWGIETWTEYVDATGRESSDVKADVYYLLMHNEENDMWKYFTDELEYMCDDPTEGFISYRSFMNDVRKELKNKGYLRG